MHKKSVSNKPKSFFLTSNYIVIQKPSQYRTVGFLREDFNHANGLIREIKIRVVFNTLHFVSRLQ